MNQEYFIHTDDQQQGPFTAEELIKRGLTPETMVWHEGLDHWVEAKEIEELRILIRKTPPPFTANSTNKEHTPVSSPIKKNSRPYMIFGLVAVAIICFVVYILQNKKQEEIERHLSRQRQIFLEQSERMQRQQEKEELRYQEELRREQIEGERRRKEALATLQSRYDEAVSNLRAAKYDLEEVQKFVFLRTASEKREQVQNQMEIVHHWEVEAAKIKRELDSFY